MKKDRLYVKSHKRNQDFNFGRETVQVFDDMLNRSVPFYEEVQRMIVEISRTFAQPKSYIYDLGCSTGAALLNLAKEVPGKTTKIIGVDNSSAMLSKARGRLRKAGLHNRCALKKADLDEDLKLKKSSIIIMNLTLQFVRPLNRDKLIKLIYNALRKNGCFILVEKVLGENSIFNQAFINLYYDFKKRQRYSQLEISQKREALENVLIPYRINENLSLLRRNGFKDADVFFKWYNFCGILALKLSGR